MYRLQSGYQLATVALDRCRLTDHAESLELTAREGLLSQLVHRLTTGFSRRTLYELLDEQAHPHWSRPALWDRLGSWLGPATNETEKDFEPSPLTDANLPHLTQLGKYRLWARQQQVVHLNQLHALGQEVAIMLSRQGWQTLISHDQRKISAQDTGVFFTSAHIDARRTVVLAPMLRRVNPWLNLVSAEALTATEVNENHQMLWFCESPEELLRLGTHVAAQIPTLPIFQGASAVTVGPWVAPQHQCLRCLPEILTKVAGDQRRHGGLSADTIQNSLTAIAIHAYLDDFAHAWGRNQIAGEKLVSAGEDAFGKHQPIAPDSFFLVAAQSMNITRLRLADFANECTH